MWVSLIMACAGLGFMLYVMVQFFEDQRQKSRLSRRPWARRRVEQSHGVW